MSGILEPHTQWTGQVMAQFYASDCVLLCLEHHKQSAALHYGARNCTGLRPFSGVSPKG